MKEINIAKTLVRKRKEKGITQDDIANFIGVSKASVSKWEIGQSYPDIVFIPQLASYFNISIDELMGYEPQMTSEDIRRLYLNLRADFAAKPFDEVMNRCNEIIKKYYSCFPLLLQMAKLFTGTMLHLIDDEVKTQDILIQAKELCVRVKNESGDVRLKKQALFMEATHAMKLGNPQEALELLNGTNETLLPMEALLVSAYQMTGNTEKSKEVLQVGIYQHITAVIELLSLYLVFFTDNKAQFEEINKRAAAMSDIWNINETQPYKQIGFYIVAAQGFAVNGDTDTALDYLQKCAELTASEIFTAIPRGDAFFDSVDNWLKTSYFETEHPLDDESVKKGIAFSITENPAFASLKENSRFINIVEKLKNNIEG